MPFLHQETTAPVSLRRLTIANNDACCVADKMPAPPAAPVARRSRLSDLDDHVHCSIIGTCLSTGELRKLVPRHDPSVDRKTARDVDIHHAAVKLSTASETVAKELTKALDTRHAQSIKRFKTASTEAALAALWRDAMAAGDVPGAYWALMTHPQSTFALRSLAFGDVHMLSHLVGASNRADIRRLAALEDECAQLRAQHTDQQRRLNDLGAKYRQAVTLAEDQASQLRSLRAQLAALLADDVAQELAQARMALAAQRGQNALLEQRCLEAEARLRAGDDAIAALRSEQCGHAAELAAAHAEAEVLEKTLAQMVTASGASALPALQGLAIAYVGGRQQSTQILARMVADAGGELLLHDGGVEDRKGLLASTLARAALAVYPVDCVSHNAMHVTKQIAARAGIPCYPLRKASVASFAELMHRVVKETANAG